MDEVNGFDLAMGALVLPPFIAVINQRRWPAQLKGLVAFAVCLAYAAIVLFLRGQLVFVSWRDTALVVLGAAFGMYKLWWQPSGIAPAIEGATSAGGGPAYEPAP